MTDIATWLKESTLKLSQANVATARLDCLVMLEDVTGRGRAWLLAHPEYELASTKVTKLNKKVMQRKQHVPLSYIRGKTEFYGREFIINKHVLEPRPESETIIDMLKDLKNSHLPKSVGKISNSTSFVIIDVGTGSGALAITASLELPKATIYACDIDSNCLKVAKKNAKALRSDVNFYQSDLLKDLPLSTFHLPYSIIANLPYVPDSYQINTAALHEPRLAIFGGPDGLDLYRQLFTQASRKAKKPSFIITEALPPQHSGLAKIADSHGYKLTITEDFIQLFENVS